MIVSFLEIALIMIEGPWYATILSYKPSKDPAIILF
jgi:hypothetical protein